MIKADQLRRFYQRLAVLIENPDILEEAAALLQRCEATNNFQQVRLANNVQGFRQRLLGPIKSMKIGSPGARSAAKLTIHQQSGASYRDQKSVR
jgi:hypothetical protein